MSTGIKLNEGKRCEQCEYVLANIDGGPVESLHEWYQAGNHVCQTDIALGTTPNFLSVACEIGLLVRQKNAAYGSSFAKCGFFLKLLYPDGIQPSQYQDALLLVRIFDKQMRIATAKEALGENPYRDIAGYGILGATEEQPASPASPESSATQIRQKLCKEK
jgi:hypothetical protein